MSKNDNIKTGKWKESFLLKTLIAIFTLMTALLNFIVATIELTDGQNKYAIIWIVIGVVFAIISIIAFCLRSVQRNYWIRSQKSYEDKLDNVFNVSHELLHRIRNVINYVDKVFFEERYQSVHDYEREVMYEMLQMIELISRVFSRITNSNVRACIKCIKYNENLEDRMKLMTFVRSGLTNIDEAIQEHRQSIYIEDNTDFEEIIQSEHNDRQRQFFYEKNLKTYAAELIKNGKRYKNSNQYWENDYITTIVCPIRIKESETTNNYNLMGFICIDSMEMKAFDNEYSDFCLDLLKGLADILYVFFERFISIYNFIEEEEKQNA